MVWLAAPAVLLGAVLQSYYDDTGLAPGVATVVTARVAAGAGARRPDLDLTSPEFAVSPGIWFPGTHELVWRMAPRASGTFLVRFRSGTATSDIPVVVSDRVASRRKATAFSSEEASGDVIVGYPPREFAMASWRVGWLPIYLVLTLVSALALRRPLRVEI